MEKLAKRIPKKQYLHIREYPMFVSDGYISNGKFAVKEGFIKDEQLFEFKGMIKAKNQEDNQPSIAGVLPDLTDYHELVITKIIIEVADLKVRVLFSPVKNEIFCIDNEIFELFKPVELLGSEFDRSIVAISWDRQVDLVIMPIRCGAAIEELKAIKEALI